MLKYDYIPRTLLISRTARRVYRTTAVFSWVLAGIILFDSFLPNSPDTSWMVPMMRLLVLLGILGAGITLVAMEFFFFALSDSSSMLANLFWFVVLALVPVGPSIYCFAVYSRSKYFREGNRDHVVGTAVGS